MDKLLQRTRMVERQAARRMVKARLNEHRQEVSEVKRDQKGARKEVKHHLRAAVRARRQDWKMGPLAPRRDASVIRGGKMWGSIGPQRARPSSALLKHDLEARCAWAGGPTLLCLAKNDRVAVVEGWLRGKITTVKEIHKATGCVGLGDIANSNVTIPSFMLPQEAQSTRVHAIETHIPISAVRLVHPIKDEATGVVRDVIIKELKPIRVHYDRPTRKISWTRIVPGLNVEVPWPKHSPARHHDYPVDTLRIDVEEKSFVPTLLRPPMPETAIDELRNRYSKFRTRHTDEYIAQKEAEAAEKVRLRNADAMLTPLQEFNRKRREERRARGQPVLDDAVLEKIGEVMAKNQTRTLRDTEISEIERGMDAVSLETPAENTPEDRPTAS